MKGLEQTRPVRPGEVDYPVIDRYTLSHFAWGILMGMARFPGWAAVGTAVGWELAERPLKRAFPKVFYGPTQDTLQNAIGDAVAMVGGWVLWKTVVYYADERRARMGLPLRNAPQLPALK